MEVVISITVCILLSILLSFNVSVHKDLLASLKLLVVLSVTAGLVNATIMFLEPIRELVSTIPTLNELPTYMLQGFGILVSFFFVWFLGSIIGLISATTTHILRLLWYRSGNPYVHDGLFLE